MAARARSSNGSGSSNASSRRVIPGNVTPPPNAKNVDSYGEPYNVSYNAQRRISEFPHRYGDTEQRVTVGMPTSLAELQQQTHRHLGLKGKPGRVKMYHHGRHHMFSPTHMDALKENDVVVVSTESVASSDIRFDGTTTHLADYVHHPSSPTPRQNRQRELKPNVPFEGESHYRTDFPRHAFSPQPRAEKRDYVVRNEPTGDSMYASQYPWHPPQQGRGNSRPQTTRENVPFEGASSYNRDFVEHELERRPRAAASQPRLQQPFEGASTYNADFHKKDLPQKGARTAREYVPGLAFDGNTEYGDRFLEHKMKGKIKIHIEPEHKHSKEQRSLHKSRSEASLGNSPTGYRSPDGRRSPGARSPGAPPPQRAMAHAGTPYY